MELEILVSGHSIYTGQHCSDIDRYLEDNRSINNRAEAEKKQHDDRLDEEAKLAKANPTLPVRFSFLIRSTNSRC